MRILHYALGLPPYARGGLTKYAVDLMCAQQKIGDEVAILWPGRINEFKGIPTIRHDKKNREINSFELINPLPLPQIYGIRDFDSYITSCHADNYKSFLNKYKPEIIHLHTLMGLHKEFLQVAGELNIRIVYTSHDFFGICPKSTLYYKGIACENNLECENCWICCKNALSMKKVKLLQSPLYRILKNNIVMQWLRKKKKEQLIDARIDLYSNSDRLLHSGQYKTLREYYFSMFGYINKIHFNSNYTRRLYFNYFTPNNSEVISITHSDIVRHNLLKKTVGDRIRFVYVGAIAEYKGFYTLLAAMDRLYENKFTNFNLHIYSKINCPKPYLVMHDPYNYSELSEVMENTDMMVVPQDVSFGFTVLEALSYGVPVLTTYNVGANDLIVSGVNGLVCDYSVTALYEKLKEVLENPSILMDFNKNICEKNSVKTMEQHVMEINNKMYKI